MVSALSPLSGLHAQDINFDPVGDYYHGASLQNQNTMQNQQIDQADYEKQVQQMQFLNKLATHAKSLPIEQRAAFANSLNPAMLQSIGIDPKMITAGPFDDQTLDGLIAQTGAVMDQHKEIGQAASFDAMTKDMAPADKEKARRVALGLDPRMMGSGAITTAVTPGLTAKVSGSEGAIEGSKRNAQNTSDLAIKPKIETAVDTAKAGVELATKPGIDAATTAATEKAKIDAINNQSQVVASGKLDDATALYNDLQSADLDKIYGQGESKYPDWARSQAGVDMIAKRNQLISMLKLGARGELKGQGSVSDSESAMVADAATLLNNPNISPALAKEALDRAMNVLRRNAGKNPDGSQIKPTSPQPAANAPAPTVTPTKTRPPLSSFGGK